MRTPSNSDAPGVGALEAEQAVEQRGLARPVGTDDADRLAVVRPASDELRLAPRCRRSACEMPVASSRATAQLPSGVGAGARRGVARRARYVVALQEVGELLGPVEHPPLGEATTPSGWRT